MSKSRGPRCEPGRGPAEMWEQINGKIPQERAVFSLRLRGNML